jgi:homoserine O-acetyltransferase
MADSYETHNFGRVKFQSGDELHDCVVAFKTYGQLNERKDNAVLFPTWFAGDHRHNEWLIGPGKALDPGRYFIICPSLLGNGLSSSPSNTATSSKRFPRVTIYDNVRLQHRLITQQLGIERLALVVGSSMGALQTFQWAALYPNMVERIAPICGAARCARHTWVFIEGVRAALTADSAFQDGWFRDRPARGLRAMARVYAGWGFSQAFYRAQLDRESLGFSSLEQFIVNFWERAFEDQDANNVRAMLWTWQNADISANEVFQGNYEQALRAITAKAVLMPSQTDLYFPPEDNALDVPHMPNAKLDPIPSVWGHFAGGLGLNRADVDFIDSRLRELLAS